MTLSPVILLRACLVLALWWVVPAVRAQEVLTLIPLHTFGTADGSHPGSLIEGRDGNLYGVTMQGGGVETYNNGTVFRLTPGGAFLTLSVFGPLMASSPAASNPVNVEGAIPDGLIQAADGNFYGVTQLGGSSGGGTAFRVTMAGGLSAVYSFPGVDANGANSAGNRPYSLAPGRDGNLYGTTLLGGANSGGVIFRLTTGGVLTPLASLPAPPPELVPFGGQPAVAPQFRSVTQGRDGNFYGVTAYDGANGEGAVFSLTPDGVLTTLHDFTARDTDAKNADGGEPTGGLTEGADGRFYGTTIHGGANGGGTVYAITPDGVLTTLYDFDATDLSGANASGSHPAGTLILGSDGNFYGVALGGGPVGHGTIFSITPHGVFTVLYRLTAADPINSLFELSRSLAGDFYVTDRAFVQSGGTGAVYALKLAPAVRPVATLAVMRPKATVGLGGLAEITVNLSATFARNLVVHYTVAGSAVNGTDDDALSGAVKIKAGQISAVIAVTARGSLGGDAHRTVKLTLAAGDHYTVGNPASAKVKLLAAKP